MSNLPQAVREAFAEASSSTRSLMALQLTHSNMPTLSLINHDEIVRHNGWDYAPLGMDVRLPALGTEPDASLSAVLDNTNQALWGGIHAALTTLEPIAARVDLFGYNTTSRTIIGGTLYTFTMQVKNVSATMDSLTIEMGNRSAANLPFPSKYYSPSTHKALYQ